MDRIRIRGGNPLHEVIRIGGAKNAALPLMAASLLTEETLSLGNLPDLVDVTTMTGLLRQHGVAVRIEAPPGGLFGAAGRAVRRRREWRPGRAFDRRRGRQHHRAL